MSELETILEELWEVCIAKDAEMETVEEVILGYKKALRSEELRNEWSLITRILDAFSAYEDHDYKCVYTEDISMQGQFLQGYAILRNNKYIGFVQTL